MGTARVTVSTLSLAGIRSLLVQHTGQLHHSDHITSTGPYRLSSDLVGFFTFAVLPTHIHLMLHLEGIQLTEHKSDNLAGIHIDLEVIVLHAKTSRGQQWPTVLM